MPPESATSATEFVEQAFETTVDEPVREDVLYTIDSTISTLREKMVDDQTVERLLRRGVGSHILKSDMTVDGLRPESFTQDAVIEPLLDTLGYEYDPEAGGLSGERTEVSDYTVSLRDYGDIDSTRLLIEAEPINKDLNSRKHGAGQVKSWLSQREFESDFGFATDGLRWLFIRYDPDSYTHNIIEEVDLQPVFIALFENQVGEQKPLAEAVFEADLEHINTLVRTFEFSNFRAISGEARQVIRRKQKEITDEFYDDYIQYVFGVVNESEETPRSLTHEGVISPSGAKADDTRLFSVELMNRLIFIKFLEDKGIVRSDLLQSILDTYEDGLYTDSLYSEFLQPLFYDVLNERPNKRSNQIQNIDLFDDIPYLNGGLFRASIEHDGSEDREAFEEVEFDVRNSVLKSILELLEGYSFSTDGSVTDLDPSVLGNVFEKTINHITADDADQNKELGAYYTPKEITRFSAERTVRPALFDRLKQVIIEERGWPEAEVDNYDTVYELIESLPPSMDLITMLLDEVDDFRVVDPACGSGHFLTSVLEEIVEIRRALWAQTESYPHEQALKKTTVQHNIYGVDIVGPAVEIAKLRCWLSIISELEEDDIDEMDEEELALPNIAFNLRQGNSLIGYTGFPETTEDGNGYTLDSFNEDTVRTRYENIINEITAYEEAITSEQAEKHRKEANRLLKNARDELIDDVKDEFVAAGVENITPEKVETFDPFHWVLEYAEVYADGGFDVIVGNPPWDRVKPLRDDYFVRYDDKFRTYMPEEKDQRQEELLEDEKIADGWEQYQRDIEIMATYFNHSGVYELQQPTVAGRTQATESELSALFLERVFQIARNDGYVAQVLPGTIFTGASGKDLRMQLLDETEIDVLAHFMNHGIFDGIDTRYKFSVLTFENQGSTDEVSSIYREGEVEVLRNISEVAFGTSRSVLERYSNEARSFPLLKSQKESEVMEKIVTNEPISKPIDDTWRANPYRELDRTNDSNLFVEDESDGQYPVLGGKNIHLFAYNSSYLGVEPPEFWSVDEDTDPDKSAKRRVREKNFRKLKRGIYDAFDGTGSQKSFVNDLLGDHRGEPLSNDDVLLDCSEYRIVYRDITSATNERTIIAAVIPPGIVCHNKLHTIRPYEIAPSMADLSESPLHSVYSRIFTDKELFAAVGLINSIPFDFLMKTKIDTTVVMYKFRESQVPRLTEGDEWFDYIWTRAARLNCYGDPFEEMRDRLGGIEPAVDEAERRKIQAEIDAAAFHAYGLDYDQTAFVLDDFHRVQNPRLMDEDYFEMVLEKYEQQQD
jgi:type I restriction-modification system DNA methylase subunit